MGFLNALFSKKQNANANVSSSSQHSTTQTYQYVISNANAFAELCRKIAKGGDKHFSFPIYYELRTTVTGHIEVYATHTVHDNDWLEFAHNRAMENDRFGVEYAYNQMIENYKLTTAELRSFQDVSDFMDFLRGGISGYNSCERLRSDIKITQKLGCVQSYEKNAILSEIKRAILNTNSEYRAKTHGSTSLEISF